jgi:nitrite reductase (NO-forming)
VLADRRGPFDRVRPAIGVAALYALAAVVWIVGGSSLVGGRWVPVHLFTLGVLTNLILALSDHFARTLTHQPGETPAWQLPAANAAIVVTGWGMVAPSPWGVAIGATVLSAVVLASYLRLRRLRRTAIGPRFAWVVRMYERAHGAFLHGAVLGALVGAGVLEGAWSFSGRTAHLHVNLLGWAGLTLLATVVFFGPTIARTRIVEGADDLASRALPIGATALSVGVLALVGVAAPGPAGVVARSLAAVGLAVFAWAVTVVCVPVAVAMRSSGYPGRWAVLGAVTWFPLVVMSDVVVVAIGAWRLLEPVGAALFLGVLAQTIVATLGYVGPMLLGGDQARVVERAQRWALGRALAWNLGVALVVGAAIVGPGAGGAWPAIAKLGWGTVLASSAASAALLATARR